MGLRINNWLIVSIVSLAVALFIGLLYDDYHGAQVLLLRDTQNALDTPALYIQQRLTYWISHDELSAPDAIHEARMMTDAFLRDIRIADIPATAVGVYSMSGHDFIAMSTIAPGQRIPRTTSLLKDRLQQPGTHQFWDRHGQLQDVFTYPLQTEHNRLAGVVVTVVPAMALTEHVLPLMVRHALFGLAMVLLTLATAFLVRKLQRTVHAEPPAVAQWVKALAEDPFAVPPTTVQLLHPLMKVILDMRSRVHFQESLLQAVVTNSPLAVLHLSADLTIQVINEAMCDMTGLPQEQVFAGSMDDLNSLLHIHPPEWFSNALFHVRLGESVRHLDIQFTNVRTGETREAKISIIPSTSSAGDVMGYTIFTEDVTVRNQWEVYSSQSDRLNLIAEFAASTAHEIRNPLTTVRGFLQLQQKQNKGSHTLDHHRIMIDEIDRVDTLITQYLTLAKQTAAVQLFPVQLKRILWDLLPLVTAEANMRGIIVSMGDVPAGECLGSEAELKQVFLNLIKNGLDAMGSGGRLYISADKHSASYTVVIRDTGSGIAPAHLHRVFDPFFTTKATGSGLGLAVCKKIVEAHHGEIEVDTEYGVGTSFFLTFPLYQPS